MPCDFILSDLPDMEQLSHTVFLSSVDKGDKPITRNLAYKTLG
jgi:hypothetical protein